MLSQPPTLISVVVPVMNESACLPRLHSSLCATCDRLPYAFEFVFVDDGSSDDTASALAALRRADGRVRYLRLSRNFGHQAALGAGLLHAAGAAVVMMDGDLQHPPGLIPSLIERWEAGFEVVNTRRVSSAEATLPKRLGSWLFYRVFHRATGMWIEPGGADFRLMGRDALDALNALPERQRFLRGLVPWLGFRQTSLPFQAPARYAGRSKFTFFKNVRMALEGLTAFSFYPLRAVAGVGWLIVAGSLGYGAFALSAHLFSGRTVPGWTSLMLCLLFFGGAQMTMIGVLGEYLGRTFEQVTGRPSYVLREAVGFEGPAGEPFRRPRDRAVRRRHRLSFRDATAAYRVGEIARGDGRPH